MLNSLIENFYKTYFNAHSSERTQVAHEMLNADVKWCVAHPINDVSGVDETEQAFLLPLINSLPDVERRPSIIMQGEYEGRTWVNSTGCLLYTSPSPRDLRRSRMPSSA